MLAILEQLRFTTPTPIQEQAIPIAVAGKDVIGIAQTGTGKTLAFLVPLLQQLARTKKQGLIILPTRELAIQVEEMLRHVGQSLGVRSALLIGGASMHLQVQAVRNRPHVFIGTPGRMIDHLESRTLNLKDVGVLVLDEADRMLDMGFAPQLKRILAVVPRDRQTMLFSATMPPEIVKIAAVHMRQPVRVEVAQAGTVAAPINQELFVVQREHKNRLLDKLLAEYAGTILVFSRTKYGAKRICRSVKGMGHSVAEIHSNLSLSQRRRSLAGFKSGAYRVLVATDIAARGIDVTNIAVVINYDLPDNLDDYVHRVGRTGRAGRSGQAITFIQPDQRDKVRLIERLVRTTLRISPLPDLPAERRAASLPHFAPTRRPGFYQGRRSDRPAPYQRSRQQPHHKRARVHI